MKLIDRVYLVFLLVWFILFASYTIFVSKAYADSLDYRTYASKMEEKYDLPKNLLVSICDYENRGKKWNNITGQHGEIGVCQIKPDTVKMICGECGGQDNIVYGDTGYKVRIIQEKLTTVIDGVFGPVTLAGVLQYQKDNNLVADGIVGPKTWKSMTGEVLSNQSITSQLWEPKKNIEYAARYIVWLRNLLGDNLSILIAAYNGGPANPIVIYISKVTAIRNSYE
jgi:hypothetical protein